MLKKDKVIQEREKRRAQVALNEMAEEAWERIVKRFHRDFPADSSAVIVVADEIILEPGEEVIQKEADNGKDNFRWCAYGSSTGWVELTIEVSPDKSTWKALQYSQIEPMYSFWIDFLICYNYVRTKLKNISDKKVKVLLATCFPEKLGKEKTGE